MARASSNTMHVTIEHHGSEDDGDHMDNISIIQPRAWTRLWCVCVGVGVGEVSAQVSAPSSRLGEARRVNKAEGKRWGGADTLNNNICCFISHRHVALFFAIWSPGCDVARRPRRPRRPMSLKRSWWTLASWAGRLRITSLNGT